jgi:hypothetical protein
MKPKQKRKENIISSIIKECDCFGTFITFRIYDDLEYKSLAGGISTILFTTIALLYIGYMSYRFLWRKEFNFIYSTKLEDTRPFINLTEVGFNLAFGVQFISNGTPAFDYMGEYLNYDFYISTFINSVFTDNPMDVKKCEKSDFDDDLEEQFDKNKLSNFYCPDFSKNINFTLNGLYTDTYFQYIDIRVMLSSKATENFEHVKNLMAENPIEMILYYIDTSIDYESRDKTITHHIRMLNKWLDFNIKKETQVFISPLYYENDENIIISDPKKQQKASFDTSYDCFHQLERTPTSELQLGKFFVKTSPKAIYYNRIYLKIPEFFANLMGILEEILVAILFLINFLERYLVDKQLIEELIKFRGNNYYDIKYLTTKFKKEGISAKMKNLLDKKKLKIYRGSQIISNENETMNLINKIKKKNTLNLSKKNLSGEIKSYKNSINVSKKSSSSYDSSYSDSNNQYKIHNLKNIDENNNNIDTFRPLNEIEIESLSNKNEKESQNKKLILKNNYLDKKKKNLSIKENFATISENTNSIENISSENQSNNNNKSIESKNSSSDSSDSSSKSSSSSNNSDYKNKKKHIKDEKNKIKNSSDDFEKKKKKKKSKKGKEKEFEESFQDLNVFQIICAQFCGCCSKKLKNRKTLYEKCKDKIHYYLDIFTYIKKMQEVDLLKYTTLDYDQSVLFNFLSTPPVRINENNKGIYNEFIINQTRGDLSRKLDKPQIDKMYKTYKTISEKNNLNFEDIKLLRLVHAEIEYLN